MISAICVVTVIVCVVVVAITERDRENFINSFEKDWILFQRKLASSNLNQF